MTSRLLLAALAAAAIVAAQPVRTNVTSGKRYPRIVVRGAIVVDGSGTPAAGPKDIVIENNVITDVVAIDAVAASRGTGRRPQGDIEIDATGKYVLPGLINAHAHIQDERGGIPQPLDYELKIWLACGITTVRDVGSDTQKALQLRKQSAEGEVAAPRIFIYPQIMRGPVMRTGDDARKRVRDFKAMGVDGLKLSGIQRDIMEAMMDEAKKQDLRTAHHIGVEETNAWDDIRLGTTSIEHWYGIPDAALETGVQNFPANYNYNDEGDRFRYGGRLWREANPEKLIKVLQAMVDAKVAWDPTMSIYEASRDVQRARTQPQFKDYLHPTLEKYFEPNAANHGSYFHQWTSDGRGVLERELSHLDGVAARIRAPRRIGRRGRRRGLHLFDVRLRLIREMELHQEAGFHPLTVIKHATFNNAQILGQEKAHGQSARWLSRRSDYRERKST
jgi:hypothetical protein